MWFDQTIFFKLTLFGTETSEEDFSFLRFLDGSHVALVSRSRYEYNGSHDYLLQDRKGSGIHTIPISKPIICSIGSELLAL